MSNKNVERGPGRPMYDPVIPRGKFTKRQLDEANGVNPDTGKGKACSGLTLTKWLKRKEGKALVVRVKGEFAAPDSKSGLGRKAFLYQRKAGVTAPKSTVKDTKATRKSKSTSTQDYEATKAALLATAPIVSVPVAPVVPETAPAEVTETAKVDETVTA